MASNNTTGLNAVNAGIAAADAICGSKLGYRSNGQDHRQAIQLLTQALPEKKTAARDLGRLLEAKTFTSMVQATSRRPGQVNSSNTPPDLSMKWRRPSPPDACHALHREGTLGGNALFRLAREGNGHAHL